MRAESILSTILDVPPPRAGGCIVTVYGDVAVPRGGSLWMGNLIEICAALGLSESLVRTAMSRLVSAGQLEGTRIGRRSYYRLTPAAQIEFTRASQIIFSYNAPPTHWLWVIGAAAEDRLDRRGFAEVASGLWLGPDHGVALESRGSVMRAATVMRSGALVSAAGELWDLYGQAQAYAGFINRFVRLSSAHVDDLTPEQALVARLALIHHYRTCLLADPRLPLEALPEGWPARRAQELFAALYAALSPGADAHIAARFESESGEMPEQTPEVQARLMALGV